MIITSIESLFKKFNKRLSYQEFIEVADISYKKAMKKDFQYNSFFYYKYLLNDLVKIYFYKKNINIFQFCTCKLTIVLNLCRYYLKFIFSDRQYFIITNNDYSHIKYLTFTVGAKRARPTIYPNIIDISFENKKIKFDLKSKIMIIKKSLKNNTDPFLEAQIFITNKNISSIDFSNNIFIIEECTSMPLQIFTSIIKGKCKDILITNRGISYIPYYFYGTNIIVNNQIQYDILSKNNDNISRNFMSINNKINKYKKMDLNNLKIGFMSDLGDMIVNTTDKKKQDVFMKELSNIYNFDLEISVHPIELINNKSKYWYRNLCSNKINIRKDPDIYSFFSRMDIVVGFRSTSLFEAFSYQKPVIILDIFNDTHTEEYLNNHNTCGMVRIIKNKEEFLDAITFFSSLDKKELLNKYDNAYRNLLINRGNTY